MAKSQKPDPDVLPEDLKEYFYWSPKDNWYQLKPLFAAKWTDDSGPIMDDTIEIDALVPTQGKWEMWIDGERELLSDKELLENLEIGIYHRVFPRK